jgi:integrase
MDPRTLLDAWLDGSTLRHTTRHTYRIEVTSWLDWCTQAGVDPFHIGIEHVARWAEDRYLHPHLDGRPFDGPTALAYLAEQHPDIAKSHDKRITAITQFYEAARTHEAIRLVPDLTMLRSGVDRDATPPKRLTPMERAVFLTCIGMWGPDHARHYRRDRLIAYLLLEGLRPGEIVRLDMRHLYELPDFTYEVRAPDYEFENVGKKHVLEPLTVAALKEYLPYRIKPAEGVHAVIIGQGGNAVVSRYPNMLIRQITATHPLLADREPPVTADTIAHTGYWDTPADAG